MSLSQNPFVNDRNNHKYKGSFIENICYFENK